MAHLSVDELQYHEKIDKACAESILNYFMKTLKAMLFLKNVF